MSRTFLHLEHLESLITPAFLGLSAGVLEFVGAVGEGNNVTVAVGSGVESIQDSVSLITLDAGAVAAGWKGSGTHSVSGPASSFGSFQIDPGDGVNVVNLRSTLVPVTIDGDTGTTTINLNSAAPTNSGNLHGIAAEVTVNAGSDTRLWASDLTGVSRPDPVVVTSSSITGLAPHAINLTGTFTTLRVSGSNSSSLAESYLIYTPPTAAFTLDTAGGNDTVEVAGDVTGNANLGTGDDTFTVDLGFTWFGNVDTGAGSDVVYYGAPLYGDITGTVS